MSAPNPDKIAILLVAAGRGARMGEGPPKQYRELGPRSVIASAVAALRAAAPQARIWPVIHRDDFELYAAAMGALAQEVAAPVIGGATRQASVRAGLAAMAGEPPDLVLIHDAARPFVSAALVARAIDAASRHLAAIPGLAVTDTIKSVDAAGFVTGAPPRAHLRAAQTPQAFKFGLIHAAHQAAFAQGLDDMTDDAALASWAGHAVHVFEGEAGNMKLTHPADFSAKAARSLEDLPDIRIGQGFDVHACGAGDHVWLGGVKIPHAHGLVGHSDADVLLHALTDAILGALADGDIGQHFPPSDPQWKGAASDRFFRDAMERVARRGGMVAHLDGTLICETPKVGPHRETIRASIAGIAGLPLDRVAVKATTSEKLGFTGRGEGIAAMAMATVRLPAA